MFAEISRVLKSNGRYICISLSQEHVLNQLIAAHSQGWITRVHAIKVAGEQVGVASSLPVFTFVMTKMATPAIQVRTKSLKHNLNLFFFASFIVQIFEYVNEEGKCVRCKDSNGLVEFVKNCQQYALVRHHLGR